MLHVKYIIIFSNVWAIVMKCSFLPVRLWNSTCQSVQMCTCLQRARVGFADRRHGQKACCNFITDQLLAYWMSEPVQRMCWVTFCALHWWKMRKKKEMHVQLLMKINVGHLVSKRKSCAASDKCTWIFHLKHIWIVVLLLWPPPQTVDNNITTVCVQSVSNIAHKIHSTSRWLLQSRSKTWLQHLINL